MGEALVALLTLTVLEIVLGIDNVIFVAVVAGRLPEERRARARHLGIALAVAGRIVLLLGITWVMKLPTPLLRIAGHQVTARDFILLAGGLFLIAKSTHEIHAKLESAEERARPSAAATSMSSVLVQILILDVVFSLDSVITAVGLSGDLPIMITAVLAAAAVMVFFSDVVSAFVERHPTMKILALSFLILIGVLLVTEGWNPAIVESFHLRSYAYFAMAFSFLVELINVRMAAAAEPVHLRQPSMPQRGKQEGRTKKRRASG
jgi:predicted tellurium resistance membrane protein TerC